jgi:hypothetical protein
MAGQAESLLRRNDERARLLQKITQFAATPFAAAKPLTGQKRAVTLR